jgi:DNA polymerase-3 subunit epsilon
MKLCFLDTETTGLSAWKNGIIQVAGSIWIEGKKVEKFSWQCKPFPQDEIHPKALEANGLSEEQIMSYGDPTKAVNEMVDMLNEHIDRYNKDDKFLFIGYNAKFDFDFLKNWMKKGDFDYFGSYFFWPPLDVLQAVAWKYRNDREHIEDYKQVTIAKFLGIEVEDEKLHEANYDVEICEKIYYSLEGDIEDPNVFSPSVEKPIEEEKPSNNVLPQSGVEIKDDIPF